MDDLTPDDLRKQWIADAEQRGWLPLLRWMLDTFEPVAPLISQMLWVAQPAAGLFGGRDWIADLAAALDSPDELAVLRHQLATDPESGRAKRIPDYTEQESGQAD
jgi:hypothetical protein